MGGVTQKVVRLNLVPTLVLRPDTVQRPESQQVRLLVGLDKSSIAEAAIGPAISLARALAISGAGELHLVEFVQEPTFAEQAAVKLVNPDVDLLEIAVRRAEEYLHTFSGKCIAEANHAGIPVTWSVEECQDIADCLIKKAEGKLTSNEGPYDALVITRQGRGGLIDCLIMGNIAERVVQQIHIPVLVVPLQKEVTLLPQSPVSEPSTSPVG